MRLLTVPIAAILLLATISAGFVAADKWCNGLESSKRFCVTGTDVGDYVDIVMEGPSEIG